MAYKFRLKGNFRFKRMFEMIDKIHVRTKKNKIYIFFDMIYCYFRYKAGYVDYYIFNFALLPNKIRKTYITRGVNEEYFRVLNDHAYYEYFDEKLLFNEKFKDFVKRDYIDIRETSLDEFKEFLKKHDKIICKPINLSCGKGIEKKVIDKSTNIEELYNYIKENKQYLVEEVIEQHPDMNKLFPGCVNTLRIVTCNVKGNVHIMYKSVRIGSGNHVVDNFNSDGMMSIWDDNGIVTKPAINKNGDIYEVHPDTKTRIEGFKIPMHKEAIEFAKKAATVIPQVGLVGWDIAITPNGPVMVEGNNKPGHDIYQSEIHMNADGTGMKPYFDECIYGKKAKK